MFTLKAKKTSDSAESEYGLFIRRVNYTTALTQLILTQGQTMTIWVSLSGDYSRQCRGVKFWVPFLGSLFSLLAYSPAANIFRYGDYSFIALRTPGLSYSSPATPAAPWLCYATFFGSRTVCRTQREKGEACSVGTGEYMIGSFLLPSWLGRDGGRGVSHVARVRISVHKQCFFYRTELSMEIWE